MTRLVLPRLYVILDTALLTSSIPEAANQMADAGVRLLQYRSKSVPARTLWEDSRQLADLLCPRGITFIVNDRPDVAALSGASGVHVGQDDLNPEQARSMIGNGKLVGISTHNLEQFQQAAASSADYIAVGPIFETGSKANPDPVVGIQFLQKVRALTNKPIVAIGGITLEHAAQVIEAGADSVAVISDIWRAPDPAKRAREFIERLDAANHAAAV